MIHPCLQLQRATLVLILGTFACSKHESEDSQQSLTDAQILRNNLCATFSISSVERCDRGTFDLYADAFCGQRNISVYETSPGKWIRDTDPCFVDGQDVGSKSECSQDTYLAAVHSSISRGDKAMAQRMLTHLEANDWICGEGDVGVTRVTFPGLIRKAAGVQGLTAIPDPFENFRGHQLGLWLYGHARLDGALMAAGPTLFNKLSEQHPASPLFEAAKHRWVDGDYSRAIDLTMSGTECASYWGSCPWPVYAAMAVRLMEGR